MKIGFVRFYNRMRGYGFLVPDDLSEDIFVHHKGLVGSRCLREGQRVGYEIGEHDGKPVALNVQVIQDVPADTPSAPLTHADALSQLSGGGPAPKKPVRNERR